MKNNRPQNFQLLDLKDRQDVIARITKAEQELNQMIDGEVALIAYVNREQNK
ncbi:hypothetical protein [Lihuaxuella thermophila]|uniref:Uncharacterized protein n=1 Tax=Lihuaxuella thermophila TaxID=1173111 RepID=A0A1H8DH84_9BACL|nr:hypothetical protein [Lihuaxuella thermophila]SEN06610.1 hypothetical protein SAMN05444955_105181 [Lihuaxuella thermophila]